VGLLTFGLVQGPDWGWSSVWTGAILIAGAVMLATFVGHCRRARSPLVSPELFRSREFTVASIIALSFSAAFGAMLLSIVLWEQGTWGWSALQAGLAISPGPLMVPVMSFLVAGRLIRRYGAAAVITLGSLAYGAGVVWWALAVTTAPNYLSGVLGGMILTGVGVGLTLPTLMATGTASLPAHAFATGSAVINMIRQTGLALGVAALVAVLGTSADGTAGLVTFQHAWWLIAALSFAGILPAVALLRTPHPADHPDIGAAP
jgi:MFS family permease